MYFWVGITSFAIGSVWNVAIDNLSFLSKSNFMRAGLLGVSAGGVNYISNNWMSVPYNSYGVGEAVLAGSAYTVLSNVGLPYTFKGNYMKSFAEGAIIDLLSINLNEGVENIYIGTNNKIKDSFCEKPKPINCAQNCPTLLA